MKFLLAVDWERLLVPKLSLLEILIRGVAVYVAVVLLLRLIPKRQAGHVSLNDLLVVGIVAGVCRNPLVADGYSLVDGLGIVVVVLACSYLITWLCLRFRFVHRLTHHDPVLLVRDGRVLHDHLRSELMTDERLLSKLRVHGLTDPGQAAEEWLEGDGEVSVIKRKSEARPESNDNGCDGTGRPATDDPELNDFLSAAAKVAERIRYHRDRAETLQRELTRWGFHPPARDRVRRHRGDGSSAN